MSRYQEEYVGEKQFHYKGLRFSKIKGRMPSPQGNGFWGYDPEVAQSLEDAQRDIEFNRAMNREPPVYYAMPGGKVAKKDHIMKTVDHWESIGLINAAGMYGLLD